MKINIFKILKKKFQKNKIVSEQDKLHVVRDWMTGLIVTSLLLILTIVYFGFDFYSYTTSKGAQNGQGVKIIEYKQSAVSAILDEYSKRAAIFDSLRLSTHVQQVRTAPAEGEGVPLAGEEKEQYSGGASTTESTIPTAI